MTSDTRNDQKLTAKQRLEDRFRASHMPSTIPNAAPATPPEPPPATTLTAEEALRQYIFSNEFT